MSRLWCCKNAERRLCHLGLDIGRDVSRPPTRSRLYTLDTQELQTQEQEYGFKSSPVLFDRSVRMFFSCVLNFLVFIPIDNTKAWQWGIA